MKHVSGLSVEWKKLTFLGIGFFLCSFSFAQLRQDQSDLELIQAFSLRIEKPLPKPKPTFGLVGKTFISKYNPVSLLLSSTLFAYQKVMSGQINSSCPYEVNCSAFAKKSLATYGLFKGMAIAADRLTRCNRLSAADVHPIRINGAGKIDDFPSYYHFHP